MVGGREGKIEGGEREKEKMQDENKVTFDF